MYTLWTMRNKV